jgi:hypothetical protein
VDWGEPFVDEHRCSILFGAPTGDYAGVVDHDVRRK